MKSDKPGFGINPLPGIFSVSPIFFERHKH